MKTAVDVIFTQMSAKKGINMFKQQVVATMIKKLAHLDRREVDGKPIVTHIDSKLLTLHNKKLALEAEHLIKEKKRR